MKLRYKLLNQLVEGTGLNAYCDKKINRGLVIIESLPAVRTILTNSDISYVARIQFPYLIHIIEFTILGDGKYKYGGFFERGLGVYMLNESISSFDDTIFHTPTEYYPYEGSSCTSHDFDGSVFPTIDSLIRKVLDIWWGSVHILPFDMYKKYNIFIAKNIYGSMSLRQALNLSRYGEWLLPIKIPEDAVLIDEELVNDNSIKI